MAEKGFALITGASKGIGKAMAIELAKRGWNLVLTARSEQILKDLQAEWQLKYTIQVEVFAADMTLDESPGLLRDFCLEKQIKIQILINNAGFGVWDNFENANLSDLEGMNLLNVTAVLRICHAFIPLLRQNEQAYLLNVGSTGAFQPIPAMALYGAGKAYIRSFTYALRDELRNSPISVTCLSPGGVWTEFMERSGNTIVAERASKWMMSADECAQKAIRAMLKGKAEVIPGWYNWVAAMSSKFAPIKMSTRIARKFFEKETSI